MARGCPRTFRACPVGLTCRTRAVALNGPTGPIGRARECSHKSRDMSTRARVLGPQLLRAFRAGPQGLADWAGAFAPLAQAGRSGLPGVRRSGPSAGRLGRGQRPEGPD